MRQSFFSVVLVAAFTVAFSCQNAAAYQTGVSGFSGRDGVTCSDQCHGEGNTPRVELVVPKTARVREVVSWRLVVVPTTNRHVAGGFDLAVDGGELAAEQPGTLIQDGEATHVFPRWTADLDADSRVSAADLVRLLSAPQTGEGRTCRAGDVTGDGTVDEADVGAVVTAVFSAGPLEWMGTWRAEAPGTYRFFAAAVAANCNGTRSGDGVGTARAVLTVHP